MYITGHLASHGGQFLLLPPNIAEFYRGDNSRDNPRTAIPSFKEKLLVQTIPKLAITDHLVS